MTWMLVRKEPSEAMRFAGIEADDYQPTPDGSVSAIFKAMLAASPPPTDSEIDELCQMMWTWGKDFHWNPPAHWPDHTVEEWRNVERDRMRAFLTALNGAKP